MADVYTTIFSSAISQTVLVFLLVFALVFAVLQKSKILGDNKRQIDSIVALVIALLTTSVGYALHLIAGLAPFLAVSLVIVLVFLLLVGVFAKGAFEMPESLRITFGVVAFLAVVAAVLYLLGVFDNFDSLMTNYSSIIGNAVLIGAIVVVIVIAWRKES